VLLLSLGSVPAQATLMSSQTVSFNPSGSNNNVTNGHLVTVFNVTPTFNKFNPGLGTLLAATLQWVGTGSLIVGGNNEGVAIMSYALSADTETWNIFGGSTTLNFSISGSESLDLAASTGTGTFSPSNFTETYQLQQGFFPATFSTGTTSGNFTLEYDYFNGAIQPAPEPSTMAGGFWGMAALGLWILRNRWRASAPTKLPAISNSVDGSGTPL
jgi:hypothetical protein